MRAAFTTPGGQLNISGNDSQVRAKFCGLASTSSSCKSHVVSFNNPTNTILFRKSGVMILVFYQASSSLHPLLPDPAPPSLLCCILHCQVPHVHIRASESTGGGNQALITISRQISMWSSMLNCSLSTCHFCSCVCGACVLGG